MFYLKESVLLNGAKVYQWIRLYMIKKGTVR